MSPWSRGWRSDRRLAARLNHQPNFVDGAWANECGAEPWRRKQHQWTDPKQQGLGCASGLRGAGVNQAVSGHSQHFLKQGPRELARKRSHEAASPASKLENAEIRAPGTYMAIFSSH